MDLYIVSSCYDIFMVNLPYSQQGITHLVAQDVRMISKSNGYSENLRDPRACQNSGSLRGLCACQNSENLRDPRACQTASLFCIVLV